MIWAVLRLCGRQRVADHLVKALISGSCRWVWAVWLWLVHRLFIACVDNNSSSGRIKNRSSCSSNRRPACAHPSPADSLTPNHIPLVSLSSCCPACLPPTLPCPALPCPVLPLPSVLPYPTASSKFRTATECPYLEGGGSDGLGSALRRLGLYVSSDGARGRALMAAHMPGGSSGSSGGRLLVVVVVPRGVGAREVNAAALERAWLESLAALAEQQLLDEQQVCERMRVTKDTAQQLLDR